MMSKCSSADRYKGIHAPSCNNGDPCEHCSIIYWLANSMSCEDERIERMLLEPGVLNQLEVGFVAH
jgi:hypothetical protein